MRIHAYYLTLIAVILVGVTQPASAIPVLWTLNDWTLDTDDTVTGSFVFDADLGTISNVNIISNLGSGSESFTFVIGTGVLEFVTVDPGSTDLTGTPLVQGVLDGNMTNAGGGPLFLNTQADPYSSLQGICANSDCSYYEGPVYFFTSGNITGTVVPVPAAVWLFGSGLLGLLGIARRT
jgi:hypothetical protein